MCRSLRGRLSIALTAVMVVVSGLLTAPPAAAKTAPYPPASFTEMAAITGWRIVTGQNPAVAPPGVNRWACTPSAGHPDPVVLVHGLNSNQYVGWANIGPRLANAGYCVFALNYGGADARAFDGGTAPVRDSAAEIAAFIDRVRSRTGAAEVDLIGHSEGGFMVLYVPKIVPGVSEVVDTVVALAPPTHGTTLHGATTLVDLLGLRGVVDAVCAACHDLLAGSAAVSALNEGPITQPGISYTTIISRHDAVITPYTSAAIREPGVNNIVVQEYCPRDPVGHSGLAYNAGVMDMIRDALAPAHPQSITCGSGPPL